MLRQFALALLCVTSVLLLLGIGRKASAQFYSAFSVGPEDNIIYSTNSQTLGGRFVPQTNITVKQLGFFDYHGDGLSYSHAIGIWDEAQNLLISTVVASGTSASLIDGYRYVSVPDTILLAGHTYRIGAWVNSRGGLQDFFTDPVPWAESTIVPDSNIGSLVSGYRVGEVLAFPDQGDDLGENLVGHVFGAANFRFEIPAAPSITITTPANGAVYALNQAIQADYGCTGNGVVSCVGPVANGQNIDTATVGAKTFTVTATDNAGNVSVKTVTYTVAYAVRLLYDSTKAVHSGATIPIKVQLCDATGANVSNSGVILHAVSVTQVSTNAPGSLQDSGNANPDFDFRYDPSLGATGGYIFNLKTTGYAMGTYSLNFTAGADPTVHSALFQVK